MHKKRPIFNNVSKIFEELAHEEENEKSKNKTLNELLQLLTKEEVVSILTYLMYMARNNTSNEIFYKNLCFPNQK